MTVIGQQLLRTPFLAGFGRATATAIRCKSSSSYVATGEEIVSGKPPVVILHGALGSGTNWKSLSLRISSALNRPVYALDAPNHGESEWTATMSYDSMAESVLEFMREKSLTKIDLIGHSMGGKTVMVVAQKHPEVVEKLIVVDSAPTHSTGVGAVAGFVRTMKELDLSTLSRRAQVAPALEDGIPNKGVREFIAMNVSKNTSTNKLYWRCNLDAIQKFLPEMATFPHFDGNSSVPTLFIGGEDSDYITEEIHPEIRRLFADVEIKKIPGSHWVHYDNPSGFLQETLSFLA
ncbi:sn-1-specific diacylglycerol lipase ABHD11-like [Sycon ciliatum]|uniref:sn-1-specific diacylglycerol lipase ABHD11-like n=1 Tax=Sycon ciliatum TaxID=27933 RepID=UPI0031F6D1C9